MMTQQRICGRGESPVLPMCVTMRRKGSRLIFLRHTSPPNTRGNPFSPLGDACASLQGNFLFSTTSQAVPHSLGLPGARERYWGEYRLLAVLRATLAALEKLSRQSVGGDNGCVRTDIRIRTPRCAAF